VGAWKKVVTSQARREVAMAFRERFELSERRATGLALAHRSTARYQSRRREDSKIRRRLLELAALRPRHGCDLLWLQLRREGFAVNRKRILRLYRLERLALRQKPRKKLVAAARRSRETAATAPTQRWSMDFMHDTLSTGRAIRLLNVLDEFHRESLAIEVDLSLPAERVIRVLDRLIAEHGQPQELWVDNGPEFTSKALDRWAAERGIEIRFIRPGKPVENCFIESFNGTLRRDCLDANWFGSLAEARLRIEAWRLEYNHDRPHTSLGGLAPAEFAALRSPTAPYELQTRRSQIQ
jgi:putative transposase